MLGLDYSAGRPSGAAVRRAGFGFVVRYLPNGLSGRVNLSAAEVADMHANGVDVAMVWERKIIGQPDRATEGWSAGVADAQAAVARAAEVGLPDNPIYFAVDFDIPDYAPPTKEDPNPTALRKLGPVGTYFGGVLSVLPLARVGIYGGYWAVKRALDAGLAHWAWQTMAWSGGQVDPRVHLIQRIGSVKVDNVDCDVNESKQTNYGQSAAEVDDMRPEDLISPVGLVDKDGKQITDQAQNFWGYADQAAQDSKAQAILANAKLDALMAKFDLAVTAERQRDAELLAAVKASPLAVVDPKLVADELAKTELPQAVVRAFLDLVGKAAATPSAS